MKTLHIQVQRDGRWLIAQALEEPGVITQGQTLDEIVDNVRDSVRLLLDEQDVHLELLISPHSFRSTSRKHP